MHENATLNAVTAPADTDGRGGRVAGATTTLARPVRVCATGVSRAQRMTLAGPETQATAVVYTPRPCPGVAAFEVGQVLAVAQDGADAPLSLEVVKVMPWAHEEGEDHWQLYAKELPQP
jgi:hypothetical protein